MPLSAPSSNESDVNTGGNLRLDPRLPILLRRDGRVQLGWDPERCRALRPPAGVEPETLVEVLELLDGQHSRPTIVWRAVECGIAPADISAILAELCEAGIVTQTPWLPPVVRSIRVHGRGPVTETLWTALRAQGVDTRRSTKLPADLDMSRWRTDLVVLADDLVPDPRLVTALVANAIPHLQVRIRDGRGIVGPFVVPGETSCLRCADLARCGVDREWPNLSAQLLGRVGAGPASAVLATSAVALAQVESVITAQPCDVPASVNATIEIDLEAPAIRIRPWVPHRLCDCWQPLGEAVN
ncbi:hypothetical protein FOS14_14980 [Skermania sp. ID1734]|uniref:hypothetical protein n=1 Tax=Skermania sp. ID1734 TaxID=2597516 RepID=UPI00117D33A0|nr:hypothetical protein [Skermania sp. ID1734]TSD97285.1 hypothetical protein FOS14_14980 [Skermania sp. ID1734]